MTSAGSGGRMVATWAIGIAGTAGVALAAAVVGYLLMRPAPGTSVGFEDLGAAIGAALLGAVVAAIGWLVLLIVLVRRYAPPGRRLLAWVASIAAVAVVALLGYLVAGVGNLDRGVGGGVVAIQAAFAAGALAPPFVVHGFRRASAPTPDQVAASGPGR